MILFKSKKFTQFWYSLEPFSKNFFHIFEDLLRLIIMEDMPTFYEFPREPIWIFLRSLSELFGELAGSRSYAVLLTPNSGYFHRFRDLI